MRNDPYYRHQDSMKNVYLSQLEQFTQSPAENLKISPYDKASSPAEAKIIKKLAELNSVINQPESNLSNKDSMEDNLNFGNDVEKLERMMLTLNKGKGDDPEIKQLDGTLEKILDIQHPERVKERIKEKTSEVKDGPFPVTKLKEDKISLLDTSKNEVEKEPGFFGSTDELLSIEDNNAIEAVVHENQSLVNGAVVKLRLLNEFEVNGALIPKGNFVFGIASLNGERLEVEVNSIRCDQSLYNVKLKVYDTDGLPGIYIPGAITRDVAKQSADNSLQGIELSTMDPSFKAQAAVAGIDAAKDLLRKKAKLIKVFVKAGYKVLLK